MSKRFFHSLRFRLLATILLGLVMAVGIFFAARAAGNGLVVRYYMDESAVRRRNKETAGELEHYVQANGISFRDEDAIARWAMEKQDIYILLYKDQHLALEAGLWGRDNSSTRIDERLKENSGVIAYPVQFPDGLLQAVIYDFSESNLYTLSTIVSVVLAGLVFGIVLLDYNSRITREISRISREVQRIGEGDLTIRLEEKGHDELSMLTASVEQMRRSILRKTEEEQKALERNSELITAMSHDIRNPLTALLGYLDLASSGAYGSAEELKGYIRVSRDKAIQLKKLTDALFRYSLLFSSRELPLNLEEFDADILLSQMLGEQTALLQQQGFEVRFTMPELRCRVQVDVQYFARVLDNLFDNLRKYADRETWITVAALKDEGELTVLIKNAIRQDPGQVESNRIGLRTCEKILEQMGGRLVRQTEDATFSVQAILPVTDTESTVS